MPTYDINKILICEYFHAVEARRKTDHYNKSSFPDKRVVLLHGKMHLKKSFLPKKLNQVPLFLLSSATAKTNKDINKTKKTELPYKSK